MKYNNDIHDELTRLGFKQDLSWASDWFIDEKNGWGFDITKIQSFYHLKNRIKKHVEVEGGKWTKKLRAAHAMLSEKYPDQLKGSTQTKKQKLARVLSGNKIPVAGVFDSRTVFDRLNEIQKNQIAIMEFLLDR